jgi:peptidoglycan/LPS O-acetylase OafA/YrhL
VAADPATVLRTHPAVESRTGKATGSPGRIRADIQGLRALAVGMVVFYHLWPNRLTGGFVGVDVFFVISGYLITSHIISKPPANLRDLALFWRRRVRRLLPASLLVLGVSAVATRIVAPSSRWEDAAGQIIASALYVQNWTLAASSVDYLAAENAASPVQHFWSLSVEEQFYLVWPILFFAAFYLAARFGWDRRVSARVLVAGVFALSLAYSIYATAVTPASAYFVTPTRMWELAAGGLVATFAASHTTRGARVWRPLIAWAGIAAIVVAGALYTGGTPFPGYTALLPVAGTAAVIWADVQRRYSPTLLFRQPPVRVLGDLSYSVYLWHWPLLVLLPYVSGGSLSLLDKCFILAATLVLSWLTKKFVEDRFRFAPRNQKLKSTFLAALAGMAVVVLLGVGQMAEVRHRTDVSAEQVAALSQDGNKCFGAAALANPEAGCSAEPSGPVTPAPEAAINDKADAYPDNCLAMEPAFKDRPKCTYGSGPIRVALVGNSHAAHWLPALQKLADERGWTITTYLASACNATDAKLKFSTPKAGAGCAEWGKWALKETSGAAYDLVVASERVARPVQGVPGGAANLAAATAGYENYLRKWASAGTRVLVLKDTPNPQASTGSVPDCLSLHEPDYAACSGTVGQWHQPDPLAEATSNLKLPGITTANLDRYFCSGGRCPGVIGNVVVYFDGHHMTSTYARTLAPYLKDPIEGSLR